MRPSVRALRPRDARPGAVALTKIFHRSSTPENTDRTALSLPGPLHTQITLSLKVLTSIAATKSKRDVSASLGAITDIGSLFLLYSDEPGPSVSTRSAPVIRLYTSSTSVIAVSKCVVGSKLCVRKSVLGTSAFGLSSSYMS